MNEKTAKQIENLKKQTIGVEIEMNHITRERAAKLAADHFGTGRYEYTASRNGYSTWSAWDAQGREWKFQKDVSIAGCDAEKCELVTPIFTTATSKPCRNWSESFAKPEQSAMQASEPGFTFTSVPTDTHRKLCETSPTLWRVTNG